MNVRKFISEIVNARNRKGELVRYVLVGGLATAIQYICYLLAVSVCSLPVTVSTMVSYGISFVANFFLSNFFTFQTRPNTKKAFSFAMSHLVNLGLQVFLVAVFAHVVGKEFALLPAMAICVPVNYLLVRFALTNKCFKS